MSRIPFSQKSIRRDPDEKPTKSSDHSGPIIIVAHGGVGAPNSISDGPQQAIKTALKSLQTSNKRRTQRALDAAVAGAVVMENDPRFDAGLGSFLSLDGSLEMDASVMDSDGNFGAVAAIQKVQNPVQVARAVIDSPHILLCGQGAIRFARSKGFRSYNPVTPESRQLLKRIKAEIAQKKLPYWASKWKKFTPNKSQGTIGIALYDGHGHFAAACSTGGTEYSLSGRIGDTPIIGCGIYVGKHGAVISTGSGEEIMKKQLAFVVYSRMKSGQSPQQACQSGLKLFNPRIPIGILAVSRSNYGIVASRQMPQAVFKS